MICFYRETQIWTNKIMEEHIEEEHREEEHISK
jgi:hypothetical protein